MASGTYLNADPVETLRDKEARKELRRASQQKAGKTREKSNGANVGGRKINTKPRGGSL